MKQSIKFFLQIAVISALWAAVIFSQGTQITIIHVNDSHSHLDGTGPRDVNLNPSLGGISRAAGVLFTLKATEPNPILLHAGDFCVGDFFFNKYFGVPELQILKQIGFDAMNVGNHEFDLGPSTLEMIYSEGFSNGSFPVVSANLDLNGYPSLSNYISPYTIKTVSGVKVGIFGMTIPAPLSNPSPVIINENIPEIAYAMVTELQGQGINVIVCLSHLGFKIDSTVAANVPGINVIVGAHDHYEFAQPKQVLDPLGHITYIVQAGSFYKNVGKLKMTYHNGNVSFNSYDLIPVTSQLQPVPEIENVISELKQGIIAQYGDVYNSAIAAAASDVENKPQPNNDGYMDSPLGNFITDAYLFNTNTKIAITANGLIADKLYHGPIVGADIFRTVAYGFDTNTGLGFNLYKCEIRGCELIKGLESSLSMFGIDNDFGLQISGFKFRFNPQNPIGQRVIIPSVLIGDKNIVMHKKYSLTLNEGLLGILLSMDIQVEKIEYTGLPEYNALVNFAGNIENISYLTEGRIQDVSVQDIVNLNPKSTILKEYRLYDNYPNPFNPMTTIKFEIPQNSIVSLKIYDILGREVARLLDSPLEAGKHIVTWDASRYASGIYFYSLVVLNAGSSAIDYTQSKRMMLVK